MRIPCIKCGAEILDVTAKANDGLCGPCARRSVGATRTLPPLISGPLNQLASLLDAFSVDPTVAGQLAALAPRHEDGMCQLVLFDECRQAFGYHPVRAEALEPLRKLAHKVAG